MNNHLFRLAICSGIVFCWLACSAVKHPILAPNDHLQEMAPDAVQGDIDECIQLANEAGPGAARGKQIAGQTAGGQLLARRLVQSREQSPEVLDLVLLLGRPAEPRQVFCVDSSDREIWMLGSSVMLRTASVRRGTTQLAGDRKMPHRKIYWKRFGLYDKT